MIRFIIDLVSWVASIAAVLMGGWDGIHHDYARGTFLIACAIVCKPDMRSKS